jgi:hypothetical protein
MICGQGDRLYEVTVSQGRESYLSPPWQGMPRETGRLVVTSTTGPNRPCSIASSNSITRCSLTAWPGRVDRCQTTCSESSKITFDAVDRSMALFRASCPPPLRGQPSAVQICPRHICLRVRCDTCHAEHLVAFSCKRRGFCPSCGAGRGAWRRVPRCWSMRSFPNSRYVSGC